jgi:5-methyltetrahydropteroyltriglutamate--homocysteine methyltransferase
MTDIQSRGAARMPRRAVLQAAGLATLAGSQVTASDLKAAAAKIAEKWLTNLSVRPEVIEQIASDYLAEVNVPFQRILTASEKASVRSRYEDAIRETIERFEATGSPVITDGEQRKYHNFWTYSVEGSPNTQPGGFAIPFAAGHTRRMPRLTRGPFRYRRYADAYLDVLMPLAACPVKQAVISPSALSLMYPAEGLPDYSRDQFIEDLLNEHETEIRRCLAKGAHCVQVDLTEGRLAMKVDPSGELLSSFIELNNLALSRFSAEDRARIGIHTCPGGDCDSTHSADVDYADLLPSLFQLKAGNFYVALAGERDPVRVLKIIREYMKPDQRVFVGVTAPIDPRIESAEEVRDRVFQAAEYIPLEQLGTTDDCGFAPFSDDVSTSREKAFAKISARVRGTALAAEALGRSA